MLTAISKRNDAFGVWAKQSTQAARANLRHARANLRATKRIAIRKWAEKKAQGCDPAELKNNPKRVWQTVKELQAGLTGHHMPLQDMRMKMGDGSLASNDDENADIFAPHFQRLFNRDDAPVDYTVTNLLEKMETITETGEPPTIDEVRAAIAKMVNGKAPGEDGVTVAAIKALPDDAIELIVKYFDDFWTKGTDYDEWHSAILKCLPKKGDLSNPNNWRGICLKDIIAKIHSSIVNTRLLTLIKAADFENQFGSQPGRGCQDALFCIKTCLELRRQHGLQTFGLFVDLVKAFDTADHELMLALLTTYGADPRLVDVVRRLYENMTVKLTIGEATRVIQYGVGVQQGDNIAPVLFLFLLMAFAQTLEQFWDVPIPEYVYPLENNAGQLRRQKSTKQGRLLTLFYFLYVDDGAFLFETREDLAKGAQLLFDHFARFGLIMHIGARLGHFKN